MKKPLIGITASMTWEMTQDEWAGYKRHYLSFDYVKAVEKAGGLPVILPVLSRPDLAEDLVEGLDGIIFSGGSDISPISFGQEPEPGLHTTNWWRDQSEIALLEASLKKNLPILGICRGFQLLNLYFKGTNIQDLDKSKTRIKHSFSELAGLPAHSMTIKKDSIMFDLLGKESVLVNSHHHQALDQVAEPFKVTGQAPDGVVEAMEYVGDDRDILAVQYHPEMMLAHNDDMLPIFTWLMEKSNSEAKK